MTPNRRPVAAARALADRYAASARRAWRWRRRSRPRTARCSRCPTRARPSGTSRTSPGSSRPSCSSASSPASCPSTRRSGCSSTATTRASASSTRAPQRGLSRGRRWPRCKRYRADVDERMQALLASARRTTPRSHALVDARPAARAAAPGAAAHRHQARAVASIPLAPAYARRWPMAQVQPQPLRWFGYDGRPGRARPRPGARRRFCFDNETPRHRAYAAPFELASRPVTYGEFLAFIDDGGYRRPELWLSMGWDWVQRRRGATAPLYWHARRRPLAATTRCRAWSRSTRTRRSATSATSRPTRSRAGPARGCRPSSSGSIAARALRRAGRAATSPTAAPSIRCRRPRRSATSRCRCSATSGSGRSRPTCPTRGYRPLAGRGRRVQRQVHVQPVRAARRLVRHAAGPRARQLPQLLPAGRAVAVQRRAPGARRLRSGRRRVAQSGPNP